MLEISLSGFEQSGDAERNVQRHGDHYDDDLFGRADDSAGGGESADPLPYRPTRIVSGGQTGVDRAALDIAIELGIPHGGWCPRGRLAEDGKVPEKYDLIEHRSPRYAARTAQNVIDSDATLILHEGKLSGGTLLTANMCRRHHRPYAVIRVDAEGPDDAIKWLKRLRPATLNIAGPRASTSPGIDDRVRPVLLELLS